MSGSKMAPICMVLSSPMDDHEDGLEIPPGEMKIVEWTVGNAGTSAWPEDMSATLFYNTHGFQVSGDVQIPSAQRGAIVQIGASLLAPKAAGHYKAMWVVA